MNKKILKNILLYICITTSLFGIILLTIIEKLIYIGIIEYNYHGIFAYEFKANYILINLLINLLYSIIGIILFILYIIKNKIKFSKKYFLLIPSILLNILLIMIVIGNQLFGFDLLSNIIVLLFIIGSPLFLFYYLNQDNKIIVLIFLCLIFPISIIISWIEIIGLMGI